jgi:hypothetical protein
VKERERERKRKRERERERENFLNEHIICVGVGYACTKDKYTKGSPADK